MLLKTQWYDDYFCLIKVCFLYVAVILAVVIFFLDKANRVNTACITNIANKDSKANEANKKNKVIKTSKISKASSTDRTSKTNIANITDITDTTNEADITNATDITNEADTAGKDSKNRFPKVFYLLIPFAVCLLLSMLLSKHKISAVFGIVDQYEGGLTIILYLSILILSYLLITDTSQMLTIIKIALAGATVVSVIGILEFTGILQIDPPYTISSTIGNSNYVGTYAVLLMPLSIAMILLETNRTKKLLYLLVSYGLVFFLLAGSMSRAGYIAAAVIIPIGFILLRKEIRKQYIYVSLMILYSVFILFFMNILSNGFLYEEIKSLNPFYEKKQENKVRFEDVKIIENTAAVIRTDRWVLKISHNNNGFSFSNERNEKLIYRYNLQNQTIEFADETYKDVIGYEYYENDIAWLMLEIDGKDIEFVFNNGKLQIVGYNGKLTDINEVEAFGFKGNESFASGRGYIWSRTFPLLKNALFIGYGPDNFIYEFPQNDIVGKLNYGAIWTIISKPHSWYLQTAFGSGILSLLFLLAMIIWYVAKTFLNSIKHNPAPDLFKTQEVNPEQESEKTYILSSCILLSVLGYCAAGIFNDSTIAVSPIFWMLFGFGIRLMWMDSSLLKFKSINIDSFLSLLSKK